MLNYRWYRVLLQARSNRFTCKTQQTVIGAQLHQEHADACFCCDEWGGDARRGDSAAYGAVLVYVVLGRRNRWGLGSVVV